MKHLKTFENFELNELTGAYMNKAYHKANSLANSDDDITSELKKRQSNRFSNYVNPNLVDRVQKLGLIMKKVSDDAYRLYSKGKPVALISNNGEIRDVKADEQDSNTLKKIQRVASFIKADHTTENEL